MVVNDGESPFLIDKSSNNIYKWAIFTKYEFYHELFGARMSDI
jgi:hypothetical protein